MAAGGAPPRPASAVAWSVGLAGLVTILASGALVVRSSLDPACGGLLVMGCGLVPALILDGAPKARRALAAAPRSFSPQRVAVKLIGFAVAAVLMAAIVALFPLFHRAEFAALFAAAPWLLALAPAAALYVALADRLAGEDGLYALGAAALGRRFEPAALRDFCLVQAIKLFFFPLMLGGLAADIAFFRQAPGPAPLFADMEGFFWWSRLIFACDVALAGLGYLATLRLFGWETRAPERSLAGWVVCLACYEPFWPILERSFLNYGDGDTAPILAQGSLAQHVFIVVALAANGVYLLSTVAFGPLFSNLTRRGIITSGPYRWSKHPAYLAKNFGWWLYEAPSLLSSGPYGALSRAIKLLCVNAIYFARARCEERMLAEDPVYGAYADYVAANGLVAVLVRLFGEAGRRLPFSSRTDELS
ncbi:MAG TPA: isoprenylcysteine carboxylmethyltransferase family protein [Roseiarcus sp.]|nr:isoprenylcysteine carboxylmethyltransferase family protein [Roseiarcus sp.]